MWRHLQYYSVTSSVDHATLLQLLRTLLHGRLDLLLHALHFICISFAFHMFVCNQLD